MRRDHLRERWIIEEVLLLALHFGEVEYDDVAGGWIMLPRFPISPRLGRDNCALLIKLPPTYPSISPHGVFVDRDLNLSGHYFPDADNYNEHADDGWAWLCLHAPGEDPATWQPSAPMSSGIARSSPETVQLAWWKH
jgi:hypothetical protein